MAAWVVNNQRISLREAVRLHGHAGPYLVLGILMGEYALGNLEAKKYFGLEIKVKGADKTPRSCIIDGLQLSTGATYGKGNIKKLKGSGIKIEFYNLLNRKKIILKLKKGLIDKLNGIKNDWDSEALAKKIYNTGYKKLFKLST